MNVKLLIASITVTLFCQLMSNSACADQERYALIIAVSDYEILPARDEPDAKPPFDLVGPKHDALEMIRLARDIGVPTKNLVVLADGLDYSQLDVRTKGLPTRRRILSELDRLVSRLEAGDQVLFYFSGHGSYQPDQDTPEAGQDEADGMDEILLPIDIGTWDDDGGTVLNAITDDELGKRIEALRERGAFVWVVIDACHSGTVLRGNAIPADSDLEYRSVTPAALGIPVATLARAEGARQTTRGIALGAGGTVGTTAKKFDFSGAVTAFYAATASETAVGGRWKRPDGSLTETMGLLTFTIREALAAGRVRTYHDLALRVSASFDIRGGQAPVPAFEGSLNRAIFGYETVAPIRWPIERSGNEWIMKAGVLDGVSEAAIIKVVVAHADAADADAYVRVEEVSATSSRLVPIAYGGLPASAMSDLSRFDPYVGTVIESGVPFKVSVGRPGSHKPPSEVERVVNEAIDSLIASPSADFDLRVSWVGPDDAADLYVVAGTDRVWLSEARSAVDPVDRAQPPWMPIPDNVSISSIADGLAARLTAFARARMLLRVMGELELGTTRDAVAVELLLDQVSLDHEQDLWPESERCKAPASIARTIPADAVPIAGAGVGTNPAAVPLRHCDVVYARVRNRSDRPVDITPLYFDRESGITYLESGRRDGIRIMPGRSRTFFVQINTFDHIGERPYPIGVEQLVIITVLQPSDEVPTTDYSYLVMRPAPPDRAAGSMTSLDQLLDAAGFGEGVTGRALSVGTGEAAVIRFGLTVIAD